MKKILALLLTMTLLLVGCGKVETPSDGPEAPAVDSAQSRELVLADSGSTLDGTALTAEGDVTLSHDIVYYQADMGAEYGEGTAADEHTDAEAAAHSVITIRKPGTYRVSGSLAAGQLAIDLGSDARRDPDAVVNLILDGASVTCTVAPALIFYNVYECDTAWVAYDEGETEEYTSSPQQDTSAAGANVILADGSQNMFDGAYVARIYKPGTEKKLHKYDGAFYSKMSMNIWGQSAGTGVLNITAQNEGLDSEMHLTLNGGTINITAQNDGINTNEDNVSVTTVNGGALNINAGLGEEGDGIDSNGHLVINGGTVVAMANTRSADGGIDADGDILLNGGTVLAFGNGNGVASSSSAQQYMELSFAEALAVGSVLQLTDPEGNLLVDHTTEKTASMLTLTTPQLQQGVEYTLTVNGAVQQYTASSSGFGMPGGMGGMGGMGNFGEGAPQQLPDKEFDAQQPPRDFEGQQPPEMPEGFEGQQPPEMPEGFAGQQPPAQDGADGAVPPDAQAGFGQKPGRPGGMGGFGGQSGQPSTAFVLSDSIHAFAGICDAE